MSPVDIQIAFVDGAIDYCYIIVVFEHSWNRSTGFAVKY